MNLLSTSLRTVLIVFTLSALNTHSPAEGLYNEKPLQPETEEIHAVQASTLAGGTLAAKIWDDLQARKNAVGIPITLGAWHWWRVPTGGPGYAGYGTSTAPGTFYYYLSLDPNLNTGHSFFQTIGIHSEMRFREEKWTRSSVDSIFWPYETYGYITTPIGVFKAGQIRRRMGLDWDGSFYGNTAFYDGLKLNADVGVSWERTFWVKPQFSIETHAQYFFREDGINGALLGGDSESTTALRLQNNAILRAVPTWWFSPTSNIALGLTGSLGQIEAQNPFFNDHTFSAWGIDLTYTCGNFKTYGEVLQSHGALNPVRYVSGGLSDRTTNYLVGMSYVTGPFTWRVNYSAGFDRNPNGHQHMFVPGVTLALTKNIDLYLEYVKWTVTSATSSAVTYENGIQAAVNWRF